jgi:hypothetical protein
MEKNIQKDTDSYRPTDRTAMNMDWVHDKYRPESPKRKETIESRLPDYNCGPKRPMDQVDSYKPALGSDGDSRDIDSYRPLSRNRQERHDHGRYGVDKPTLYHTLLDHIVEKAFTEGVSSDSFFGAYYRCGKKAKDDKPTASAYWLLWRQECMIWKHLCMSH